MTKDALSWDWYRTFLAVLEEGSLSGAARRLGLAQPTAGRHIEQLEKGLGMPLFLRAPQGLLPTAAALALRPYATNLATTAAALLRVASSQGRDPQGELTGTVRISASDVIGVEALPPLLANLRRVHPRLVVELVLSNRIDNLLQGEADIAVRMRRPEQDALVARRIGNIEMGLFARADYLERAGVPEDWQALREHSLIGIDSDNAFTRGVQHMLGGLRRDDFSLRSDSYLAHLALIRAGAGIGICMAVLARRSPGPLRRVLPQLFAMQFETWLVMHENLRENPACQAVYALLADGLVAFARGDAAPG